MKDQIITFETVKKMNSVDLDGLANAFSKHSFWHYTKKQNLEKIFSSDDDCGYKLLCNRIDNMNDLTERNRFNAKNVFVTCFCNTDSEKIPMWFLYGSLTSNGVAIGLTPKKMLDFLKSIDFVYAEKKGKIEKYPINTFDINCGWICYKKQEHKKTKFYYRQEFYEISDYDDACNDYYFIKDYEWNYEKEFRIVITDREDRYFDKIFLPIPQTIAKNMKLKTGKSFKCEDYELPMSESKIKLSSLNLEMNLLDRCKDEVLAYIEEKLK